MSELLNYILNEVKNKRLIKSTAIELLRDYNDSLAGRNNYLHPLVHQNISDIYGLCYSSQFTGDELFLADHLVRGVKVLPAVVYLEMVRAAIEDALRGSEEENRWIKLKDVVWLRPFVLKDKVPELHVRLNPEDSEEICWKIYSTPVDDEMILHAQGTAELIPVWDNVSLDIPLLQSECVGRELSSVDCYKFFDSIGISYGPGHQRIEKIFAGKDKVLAVLSIPIENNEAMDTFKLHPGLMDGSLQAAIGFMDELKGASAPALPFSLKELEIYSPCKNRMLAYLRYSENKRGENESSKLDIDLCDESGKICVRMKGYSSRIIDDVLVEPEASRLTGNIMLVPFWDIVSEEKNETPPCFSDKIIIIGGTEKSRKFILQQYPHAHVVSLMAESSIDTIAESFKSYNPINHIFWLVPDNAFNKSSDEILINGQKEGVIFFFRIIKALLASGYGDNLLSFTIFTVQTLTVYKDDFINPTHAGLHGFIGSLAKEYPRWKIRLIDIGSSEDFSNPEILAAPADPEGNVLAYRSHLWYRQKLLYFRQPVFNDKTLYRKKGVYVVVGGAGGIGEVWSEYMIRTFDAQIIWLGRRQIDKTIQDKLDRLVSFGSKPCYFSADATDREALQAAYEEILKRFSKINGVIHSAIVLSDKSLFYMEEKQFMAGLEAKIDVSVRIAQVFKKETLDFVLFFSSMIAFTKSPGQSNYAAGCTFKDSFASILSQEWGCKVKVMNWGYWGSVGIVASKEYQNRMEESGVGSIEMPEAVKALDTLLSGPFNQMGFMNITKPLISKGNDPEEVVFFYPRQGKSDIRAVCFDATKQSFPNFSKNFGDDGNEKEIDELLHKLLWVQLQKAGLMIDGKIDEASLKLELHQGYDRWLDESIAFLFRKDYLLCEKGLYSIPVGLNLKEDDVWREWEMKKEIWFEIPRTKALVKLVETTLRALPDIIKGKRLATDILFPGSSMELVRGIYKHNPTAAYFNEVVSDIVFRLLETRLSRNFSGQIRIFEIGAGTGGTSFKVFEKLKSCQKNIEEYCYTDISKAFLIHAEEEYGPENPYLTYKLFDVERPVAGQDVEAGSYDIVIATNVLHATKNICQTLRNVKALLRNHGLLILNEMSGNNLFTHLTFGLLEGWWLYEDPYLRIPGSPILAPESWQNILKTEGFAQVVFPVEEAHKWGQQIVVAESDGIIRQRETERNKSVEEIGSRNILKERTEKKKTSVIIETKEDFTDTIIFNYIKEIIVEKLSASLKVDVELIDDEESFADYGLDSILGVNLVGIINNQLEIKLDTTTLFDYNSVNSLTRYIFSEYGKTLGKSLKEKNNAPVVCKEEIPQNNEKKSEKPKQKKKVFRKKPVLFNSPYRETERLNVDSRKDQIAIIGMSGRFAKSQTVHDLWDHLAEGRDLVEKVTRWDLLKDIPEEETGYCNYGSFLDDIDLFDPLFFNISGIEANYMDPQQRFFLEESWRALEDAGYAGKEISERRCGVYVGTSGNDYQYLVKGTPPPQAFWGNAGSVVPARIAYYLDLKGPAITIDTACSSSLVAIHLACQGLWTDETDIALAGGVFIQSTSRFYLSSNGAGMLSPAGHCHAFDSRADGFVPGEGVGVIVLKRLKDAMVEGDHIYGVVKGSGLNQDGKTNGITAPSSNSQEELEKSVYNTFQINPENIQMVEAHGTGTILGDPIEFKALTNAFREFTEKKEYCAVGSIKTNVGHTATAAGIAGVIKILLSLKHKQIPASLHYENGNPNITFKDSPFYINTTLKDWETAPGEKRCAVVSSFGFSGTNAHMAIEEAPVVEYHHFVKPGYLIVLSARCAGELRRQVEQLIDYIKKEPEVDCGNMSYTLLMGRKHMGHRLACVVRNNSDLLELLTKWFEKRKVSRVYVAELNEKSLRIQPSLRCYGNECALNSSKITDGKEYLENLSVIADLYIQGYELDYEKIFTGDLSERYLRIPLPTYPFARERFWVPEGDKDTPPVQRSISGGSFIHPLLHKNTSNLIEQRFSSIWGMSEFPRKDFFSGKNNFFSSVACLEMARAALKESTGTQTNINQIVTLRNIKWGIPISFRDIDQEIHISLFPGPQEGMIYEIYSQAENHERVVYNQGELQYEKKSEEYCMDLDFLKALYAGKRLPASDLSCVGKFLKIEEAYTRQDGILLYFSSPKETPERKNKYAIFPVVLEDVLRTASELLRREIETDSGPLIPVTLDELKIFNPCPVDFWVHARYQEEKLAFDLCDEMGKMCLEIKGYAARHLTGKEILPSSPSADSEILLLKSEWKEVEDKRTIGASEYERHCIILCGIDKTLQKVIEDRVPGGEFTFLSLEGKGIAADFELSGEAVFKKVKTILEVKPRGKVLIQILFPLGKNGELFYGLGGILKTASRENPKIEGQTIAVSPETRNIPEKLIADSLRPLDKEILYKGDKRFVSVESVLTGPKVELPWKEGGVYLITGGAGALGLLFASEITRQVKDVTLYLTSRSSLDKEKSDRIKEIEKTGGRVIYRQTDVSDKKAVKDLIKDIRKQSGTLHGIIHSAGIIRDNYMIKKEAAEFREVLAPKIRGTVNLDEASSDLPLDFFILFSSLSGVLGNVGQSDYSCANGFLDKYAGYRKKLVSGKKRKGKSLSVNWPLWKEGGMDVDHETKKLMKREGIDSLDKEKGIQVFYQSISSGASQVIVFSGNKEKFFSKNVYEKSSPSSRENSILNKMDEKILKEKVLEKLKVGLGDVTGITPEQIDALESLESYGIDSIMITQLNQKLETIYHEISKTLFYEYQTLDALSDYLLDEYPGECRDWVGPEGGSRKKEKEAVHIMVQENDFPRLESIAPGKSRFVEKTQNLREPIAVIGMSGRYPQARDLDEFWENLEKGKDCITEISSERWPLSGFYHEDYNEALAQGKSYSKWGGFIDGFAEFDPLFFNISPREAMNMDPQERLFLQESWRVIEDAGYTREKLSEKYRGRVGVFAGITKTGFDLYGPDLWREGEELFPHTSFSSVANRISYLFDFHGPSMPVDTMCSSSLTAVHEACEHLNRGDCEMALAGGVNIYLHPSSYVVMCGKRMLSPDGRCRSFGLGGNGFVPGEGVGLVLLKPLSLAEKDGDHIYGVIRGTSINHGGKTSGYTVPNPNAQGDLVREAMERAGVHAQEISYIEAHGTGTKLGDPIEITGLINGFGNETKERGYCAIGSAKSNIGHLEAAAGIAGLTKILLQMEKGKLAPSLHAKELNPNINFGKSPFTVQQELGDWKRPVIKVDGEEREIPRTAGISSFGAGGANAHVIVQEYNPQQEEGEVRNIQPEKPVVILLSARTADQLKDQAVQIVTAVDKGRIDDHNLLDAAYTLQVGREAMEVRLALLVGHVNELKEKLDGFINGTEGIAELYQGRKKEGLEALRVLADDEELKEAAAKWLRLKKLSRLADLWVKGVEVEWEELYRDDGQNLPRRISLPAYPFSREEYWFDNKELFFEKQTFPDHDLKSNQKEYREIIDAMKKGEFSVDEAIDKIHSLRAPLKTHD